MEKSCDVSLVTLFYDLITMTSSLIFLKFDFVIISLQNQSRNFRSPPSNVKARSTLGVHTPS